MLGWPLVLLGYAGQELSAALTGPESQMGCVLGGIKSRSPGKAMPASGNTSLTLTQQIRPTYRIVLPYDSTA